LFAGGVRGGQAVEVGVAGAADDRAAVEST